MKRSGWIAAAPLLLALSLPGCGTAPRSSEPAAARPASATSVKDIEKASREGEQGRASSKRAEAALTKEEGHPFWNVVGAALGLAGTVLVVAMMLGGF